MARRHQLQWAALLAIAVVLPTVSLLWFMSQVIANERLVVGQKLAALYQDKLADASARTTARFTARLGALEPNVSGTNPYPLLRQLVRQDQARGVVVWDAAGTVWYPQAAAVAGQDAPPGSALAEAARLEFSAGQPAQAAARYAEIAATSPAAQTVLQAQLGRSRCLAQSGQFHEAVAECARAAFASRPPNSDSSGALRWQLTVENARLLLLSLLDRAPAPADPALRERTLAALQADLFNASPDQPPLPANHNLFLAQKVLAARHATPAPPASTQRVQELEKLAAAEALSLAAAETISPQAGPSDVYFPTMVDNQSLIGLRHQARSRTVLVLLDEPALLPVLDGYREAFAKSEVACRILNPAGGLVTGLAQPKGRPFLTAALPAGFPDWQVELYFAGGDVFELAARRQIAVYIWTGVLVILLIFIAGAFAVRAVGRQIRLNQMKNDFIATVSHELKTPLASMRVLVDTLLEGRVRDEAQAQEYLRLTVKENERLSRMIDNFLTFSRMERDKVAFTLLAARPGAIASDAVAAVKTKFAAHHCVLTVAVAENLPDLTADHDAIVTVLVNLLDNACKYTTDHKQIRLEVLARERWVVFAISDNGIGLARRHHRKIFERFYQVDNSLARRAEGCGLGLSIVKFIVDAHHGRIVVESAPGAGSTFTVFLPVAGGEPRV